MSCSDGVLVETDLGKPALSNSKIPKSLLWEFPFEVKKMANLEPNYFLQKQFNFLLRTSQIEGKSILHEAVARFSGIPSFLGRSHTQLVSTTKQYIELLNSNKSASYHFTGYFQTARGVYDFVRENRLEVKLREQSTELLNDFKKRLDIENSVFVHARIGDYASERRFGIAPISYYEKCLTELSRDKRPLGIYLFSDDPEQFISMAPESITKNLKYVSDPRMPDYLQFELFRLGKKYVIANSTFSWMGAALSESAEIKVFAPNPWFIHRKDPIDLIPAMWIEVSR
jgi:hypothetical protein